MIFQRDTKWISKPEEGYPSILPTSTTEDGHNIHSIHKLLFKLNRLLHIKKENHETVSFLWQEQIRQLLLQYITAMFGNS